MASKAKIKGWRNRRKAITELEASGWLVDTVEKTHRFAKQKDCFGLFDILALDNQGKTLLLQVTTNVPHSHWKYEEFAVKYPQVLTEQWVYMDKRKPTKKFRYPRRK